MNKLEALHVFCTVAETLHFRETAQRLAVSPQVITRMIYELEQELGEVLFQRSTRQVKLTDFGKQFLPQAQQLVADTEALFAPHRRQHEQRIAGVVRIAVPDMPLMQMVLAALLQKLTDYPDLMIDWQPSLALVDVVDKQIDVGLRFGTPEDSRLIIRKVGTAHDCIVASPRLVARVGQPETWQSLQRHYPLSALLNPNTGRAWAWYLSPQYQFQPAKPVFISPSIHDGLVSALAGQTFACLPNVMCQSYLASGELVEIFPELERKQWMAYVYRPQQTLTHARVKLVFDLLGDIVQEHLVQAALPAKSH